MTKTLMVIGAGEHQLPAIIKAKEMGLKVLATDLNPNALGFEYADINRVVDVRDEVANLKVATEFTIDGVISIVSELSVRTTAYVAEQLGLPGLRYEAAITATDKAIMRRIFSEADLSSPVFFKVNSREEAIEAISKLGLPVIMKPTDNSGSRGVTKIENLAELDLSWALAKKNSFSGDVIVEQFLEGTEMTIEGLSYNGEHQILALSSKKRIPFPACVSIDLTYPPPFSEQSLARVRELIISALNAMGVNMGATHSEVMMTKRGPILIEVAVRGGGYGVFSEIIPLVSGVNAVEECINMAIGYKVDISPKFSKAAVLRFFNLRPGRLIRITGLRKARDIKGVHRIDLSVSPGDMVRPIVSDGTRHGLIITSGDVREVAIHRADQAETAVKFDIAA
ncbi:ATP-grasp domain-containing protein [Chloroflexota bacterium]